VTFLSIDVNCHNCPASSIITLANTLKWLGSETVLWIAHAHSGENQDFNARLLLSVIKIIFVHKVHKSGAVNTGMCSQEEWREWHTTASERNILACFVVCHAWVLAWVSLFQEIACWVTGRWNRFLLMNVTGRWTIMYCSIWSGYYVIMLEWNMVLLK
jgi:hypothetical protein